MQLEMFSKRENRSKLQGRGMLCHWRSSAVERSEYLKDYSHVQVDKTKDQDENNFLWHSSTPMKATLQQELRLEAQNTLCQVLTLVTGIRKHLRQVLFNRILSQICNESRPPRLVCLVMRVSSPNSTPSNDYFLRLIVNDRYQLCNPLPSMIQSCNPLYWQGIRHHNFPQRH